MGVMPEKTTLRAAFCCACLLLALCASCSGGTLDVANHAGEGGDGRGAPPSYELSPKSPSVVQPIEPRDAAREDCKFVQVEVAEVVNPKKYPLTFRVRYRPASGEEVYLGSFSLYPADNPGKFIVATQGKLRNEGAVVLSMDVPENVADADALRVTVKRMRFLKG